MNDREALAGVCAWAIGLSLAWAMSGAMTFDVKRASQPLKLAVFSAPSPVDENPDATPGTAAGAEAAPPAPASAEREEAAVPKTTPKPSDERAPRQESLAAAQAAASRPDTPPTPAPASEPERALAVTPLRQDQWHTERPRLQASDARVQAQAHNPLAALEPTPAPLPEPEASRAAPAPLEPPPAPPEPSISAASVSSFANMLRRQNAGATGGLVEPQMPASQTVSATRIPASQEQPTPGGRIPPGTFKLLGVEPPNGEILVLGVLVNDQGRTEDVVIVVPSQYALGDIGLVMGHFRKTWPDLVPPLLPGEKRWLELRFDYDGIDPNATQGLP